MEKENFCSVTLKNIKLRSGAYIQPFSFKTFNNHSHLDFSVKHAHFHETGVPGEYPCVHGVHVTSMLSDVLILYVLSLNQSEFSSYPWRYGEESEITPV